MDVIILIVIFIALYIYVMNRNKSVRKPKEEYLKGDTTQEDGEIGMNVDLLGEELMRKESYADREYSSYIAGVSHHCSTADIGVFVGFAVPQPDNTYDKNAVAIINNRGKLLGYVAKKELSDFKEWSDNKTVPCVGHISLGNEGGGTLHTNVKFIRPYTIEFIKKEVSDYIDWYNKNKE